jgi:hypothetical protein
MARIVETGNTQTTPVWAADYLGREHLVPGGIKVDAAQFNDTDAVVVTVGGAGAAQGATSIPVDALSGPIPSGATLRFGADEYATLTAAAAAGATSLTVAALVSALEAADTATYAGAGRALKTIRSGTPVGRTIAERDAGTAYGPAAAADDEVYLLAFDIVDADVNNDGVLYRPGSVVKENYLPNVTSIAAGVMTKLRAAYVMQRGTN